MGRALVAAALLLALCGCSTVAMPPSGLTVAESAELWQRNLDVRWQYTGLDDEMRPPDPIVRELSGAEWADNYVACLNAAGFDNYRERNGRVEIQELELTAAQVETLTLANYVCDVSFRTEGFASDWKSPAQADYLYDYYEKVLVPCMALRGIDDLDPPTRAEFADAFGQWNPYWSVTDDTADRLTTNDMLFEDCPPVPTGMADPGYADAWN